MRAQNSARCTHKWGPMQFSLDVEAHLLRWTSRNFVCIRSGPTQYSIPTGAHVPILELCDCGEADITCTALQRRIGGVVHISEKVAHLQMLAHTVFVDLRATFRLVRYLAATQRSVVLRARCPANTRAPHSVVEGGTFRGVLCQNTCAYGTRRDSGLALEMQPVATASNELELARHGGRTRVRGPAGPGPVRQAPSPR